MRPIPKPLLKRILADPYYAICCHPNCGKQAEIEHAIMESGRQLNEYWALIPCCPNHNRGPGLNKEFNKYIAFSRATENDLAKYPKSYASWKQEKEYLIRKYGESGQ